MDFGLIALLIGGAVLMGKKKTAESLEFFPQSLALSKDKRQLYLVVDILNPTKGKLTIDGLFLKIYAGATKIGSIEKSQPFTIRKSGRSTVKFPIKISPVGLGQFIADILLGKVGDLRVVGIGRSSGIDFPIEEKIDLDI